jgi:hypothetical protein
MDSATRKFVGTAREFLNELQGRQHMPFKQDTVNGLDVLVKELEQADPLGDEEMSPGERQALGASEGLLESVELSPEDSLTPGEKAAQQAASAGAS